MQFAIAVDLAAVGPCIEQHLGLALVFLRPLAQRGLKPCIESARLDTQAPAHGPDGKLPSMLSHEGVSHLASLAKYALAIAVGPMADNGSPFLRNSLGCRNRSQFKAECLGAALEVGQDAGSMAIFIRRSARIVIGHAKTEGIVEQDSDLARGRSHGLLLTDPGRQPSMERTQSRIATPDGRRCQPQQGRGSPNASARTMKSDVQLCAPEV